MYNGHFISMNPLKVHARGRFNCEFLGRVSVDFYQILDESTVLPNLSNLKRYTILIFAYLIDDMWVHV